MRKQKTVIFAKHEITETILKLIGVGLIVGGSIVAPNLPIAVYAVIKGIEDLKKRPVSRKKVIRSLEILEKKEVIAFIEKDKEIFVKVRDVWNAKILRYSIQQLIDFKLKQKKWDGRWFMVFFDVPEKQRNKRDQTRKLLRQLGFYQYQKSVYIFPYECKEEIKLIKRIVEGASYMKYVIVSELEDESKLKKYFDLTSANILRS
ncbi:MAG: CRISPR-associated endonuclease Cas2 [Patescibacteria group bacterium]